MANPRDRHVDVMPVGWAGEGINIRYEEKR